VTVNTRGHDTGLRIVSNTSSARKMSTWEKNLLGVTVDKVPSLLPGLLVAALLAWFSIWLSKYVGVTLLGFDKTPISAVMLAILLGPAQPLRPPHRQPRPEEGAA